MIPEPVAEFLEFRVRWLELQPALALLLEKEERLPATTSQIRSTVAGTALESQIAAANAAILFHLTPHPGDLRHGRHAGVP